MAEDMAGERTLGQLVAQASNDLSGLVRRRDRSGQGRASRGRQERRRRRGPLRGRRVPRTAGNGHPGHHDRLRTGGRGAARVGGLPHRHRRAAADRRHPRARGPIADQEGSPPERTIRSTKEAIAAVSPVITVGDVDVAEILVEGPWRHRFVAANGARFHVAEAGSGPLVLLLHGFPEFWWAWRAQLVALAEAGYHAVAMDLRGYGASDKPPAATTPRRRPRTSPAWCARSARSRPRSSGTTGAAGSPGPCPACSRASRVPSAPLGMAHPLTLRASLAGRRQRRAAGRLLAFQAPLAPERSMGDKNGVVTVLRSWAGPGWPDAESEQRYMRAMKVPFVAHTSMEYYRWAVRSVVRSDGRRFAAAVRDPVQVPVLQIHGGLDPWVLPRDRRAVGRAGGRAAALRAPARRRALPGGGGAGAGQRDPARVAGVAAGGTSPSAVVVPGLIPSPPPAVRAADPPSTPAAPAPRPARTGCRTPACSAGSRRRARTPPPPRSAPEAAESAGPGRRRTRSPRGSAWPRARTAASTPARARPRGRACRRTGWSGTRRAASRCRATSPGGPRRPTAAPAGAARGGRHRAAPAPTAARPRAAAAAARCAACWPARGRRARRRAGGARRRPRAARRRASSAISGSVQACSIWVVNVPGSSRSSGRRHHPRSGAVRPSSGARTRRSRQRDRARRRPGPTGRRRSAASPAPAARRSRAGR